LLDSGANPTQNMKPDIDTQNKEWSQDKSKFGYRMLQKMGWSEGKGLGVNEDGSVTHLRARKKTSNAGIGCSSASKAAWNLPAQVASDLNDVLARLSASATVGAHLAAVNATAPLQSSARKAIPQQCRGYMSRRAAGKTVGTYSKEALREIFGGAPLSADSPCADGEREHEAEETPSDVNAASKLSGLPRTRNEEGVDEAEGSCHQVQDDVGKRKERQLRKDRREQKERKKRKSRHARHAEQADSCDMEDGHLPKESSATGEQRDRSRRSHPLGVASGSGVTKRRVSKARSNR
jgi:Pin2-interacting protein X1